MSLLLDAAVRLRPILNEARSRVAPRHFTWYPYDSLANFVPLDRLFSEAGVDPVPLLQGQRVLDVGCADGDFAFCLESLGARVTAIDHPRSSQNGMQGVRALQAALSSPLELWEMDIDRNLNLGEQPFELAFVLGVLYHLKNPFYVLDAVARSCTYCAVSTRVMRRLPLGNIDVRNSPISYLLGAEELNGDDSNFWIFTTPALERVFERSHWTVLPPFSLGDTAASRPDNLENDERAFYLLKSTFGLKHLQLRSGWHQPEDSGWRWTDRIFSVMIPRAGTAKLRLYVPDALIDRFGPITLQCSATTARQTYMAAGLQTYSFAVSGPGEVTFMADHALPPSPDDPRERAIIVADLAVD